MNRRERGASLVEVLVSLVFLGLFAGEIHQFARTILRGIRVLEAVSEAQEGARIGVELIVRDLRGAGFGADRALGNGLRVAAADAVEIAADLNADGDIDDTQEVVGYRLDPDRRTLMRVMGGVPQPMLADVNPGGFRLSYYATDDSVVTAGGGPLDAAARQRVRRLDVVLTIEMTHPDPAYTTAVRVTQTASVCLRNG